VDWVWLGVAVTAAVYGAVVLALVACGRRTDARAFASFVPDCAVLSKRLLADRRVSMWRKAIVAVSFAYLASPIDLVPDFLPVVGQLDDAIVVALVLRTVIRGGGPELLEELWPGPERSLNVVRRLAHWR
jgi:uncharacterized membrane protein YkvA (DUF1232 family)